MKVTEFEKILKMKDTELLTYLADKLKEYKYQFINANEKYVYAKGEIPILLVAHVDIVHQTTPELILYDSIKKMMWSPTGIGGDDRCGVGAILSILEQEFKPSILFTTGEEIGGIGANAFCKDYYGFDLGVNYAIEIDRRGRNQAVFYSCGNQELQDYICKKHGFELKYGTFTDVCIIGKKFDIGIVNLSAGYYNEHTNTEYIRIIDLNHTIKKIIEMFNDDLQTKFKYEEKKYSSYSTYSTYTSNNYDYRFEIEDYKTLDDETFTEYYEMKKPKTLKEFLKKVKTIKYYEDMQESKKKSKKL